MGPGQEVGVNLEARSGVGRGRGRHPAVAPLTKAWHCWMQEGWRSWLRVVTHPVDFSCLRRDGVCLSSPHVEPGPLPWAFHVQDFARTLLQELKDAHSALALKGILPQILHGQD